MFNLDCLNLLRDALIITEEINSNLLSDDFDSASRLLFERNKILGEVTKHDLSLYTFEDKEEINMLLESIKSKDKSGSTVVLQEKKRVSADISKFKKNQLALSKYTEIKM